MFKVGVTGGIGSGKSTVTALFETLGVTVVDADIVAREVIAPGSGALQAIVRHFGSDVLNRDGSLNRGALRARVFEHPAERQWLEALLHPLILAECDRQLEQASGPYALLAAPLLIESGQYRIVDRILVVDVPESVQLARTAARDDADETHIQAIIDAQLGREERLRHADDVLDNSQDLRHLETAVEQLHHTYLTLAG